MTIPPRCRSCGAAPDRQCIKGEFVYGGRADQKFWHCSACDMIYLSPPMSEDEEQRFYRQEFEKFMAGRAGPEMDWTGPEQHVLSNQREVQRRVPFLEPFIKSSETALEIGCSSGFMLMALRERGLDVCGIDPSGGFVEFVHSKGIPCFGSLEEMRASRAGGFDLIIHYYVLEHVGQPVEFVKQHMAVLKPNGKMVFEVPCAADPLIELYQVPAFQNFYWSVAHHWYFTRTSLGRVLRESGFAFDLFPEQRYDLSNHMVWMQEGKPGGYGRYASVFGRELDAAYKKTLKDAWLCDTLVAVVHRS